MVVYVSDTQADELAAGLFASMTDGMSFTIPDVDLTASIYQIPSEVDNDLYTDVTRLDEAALTQRVVGGTGLFDGLMVALDQHLAREWDADRITGKEYATAYVQLTTAALQSAITYLLQRDSAYWQAQMVQKQARLAEIQAVNGRVALEISKSELAIARTKLEQSGAEYALTKLKLSTEDANHELIRAQSDKAAFELASILPKQADAITADIGLTTSNVQKIDYEVDNLLPKEVLRLQSQIDVATAEILRTTAQKDQLLYQTGSILPAQALNIAADTSVKEYQAASVMPAQVDGIIEDNLGKTYQRQFIMPAQLTLVKEQGEVQRAQTLDTRSDAATVVGSIGKQKALYTQQTESYKRADEMKYTKAALDTWITQKSIDEGILAPNQLVNTELDEVIVKVRANLGLS